MSTVLIAWELGAGLGHVRPLLAVAEALAQEGHRPVLALRDTVETWPVLRHQPFPVLPAPMMLRPMDIGRPFAATSMTDVLAVVGWGAGDSLEALHRSWQGPIDAGRPSLAGADFA